MAGHAVPVVDTFGEVLEKLLQRAGEIKQTNAVEPPLNKLDFQDILEQVESTFFSSSETVELRKRRHAAIDTAIRDKFNDLLVCLPPRDLKDHRLTARRHLRRSIPRRLFKCGT